jgi:hypothetical protein
VKITRLRVDGQEFYLPPELDVAALQQQILDAVRVEAAFITFRPVGHGDISVLITPHIPVRFEAEHHTAEEFRQWTEDPPAIDIGDYFHKIDGG